MSESQSRLAVIIDSTGAQKNAESLTTALDKMTQSGDKAVTGMLKVTKASDEEKAALEKLKAAIDPIGAAINTVGRRFTELQKYFEKGLIDEEEFRTLSRLLHETTEELSGVAQAQRDAEKAGKDAAAQLEVQSRALQATLDKVDPLAAALRNLEQQQKDLSTALSQGKINTSQYDTYTKKLQDTRREVTGEAQAERDAIKAREEQVSSLRRLEAQIDPVGEAFRRLAEQQRQLDSAKSSGMLSPLAYDRLNSKLAESRDALEKTSTQFGKTGMSAAATANAMRMVPAQMTDIIVSLQGGQAPLTVLLQQGGQLKDMFGGIVPAAKAMGTYVAGLVNPFTLAAGAVGLLTYAVYSNRQELEAASKLAKSSLGATGDYAEQLAMNILAISDNTGKAVDEVASMFIMTNDGASEAISKLIDVGYGYDDARKMVESYKGSANFTALNKDIDEHQRKILKIGDAWTAAAIDVKNYYTGAQFGKQDVALGGAIDPSMRFIGQAVDLQNTINELRIQGNKEVAASVDWITKEYLATDRVAGAEDRLKQAREQARKIAASGNQEAITQANNLIALREKEVEQAKKAQEPKQKKEKAYTEDAATRLLDQINQQTASLMDQLQTTDKLSAATKQRIKFEQQIADIKTKSQLTADQKSLLANADAIEAALRRQEIIQSQVTTLDDYRKMQEQVKQKDVQTNDLLIERLKLLDKAKAAGATDTDATRANVLRTTKASLPSSVTSVTGGLSPTGGQLSGTWDGLQAQTKQLQQAQTALDQWQQQQLQSYQAYYQNRSDLTAEYEQQIAAVRQQYQDQSTAISSQQNTIQVAATQSIMDSMVSITRDGFGEQSAIYKAAFIANKAYAIAQATLSINQGIAMAAANPFPYNLVAMASVAAATASIVSNLASVSSVGFEKGGYTGNMGTKSVAGVVHGKEFVFDAPATKRIGVSNLEAIRSGNLDATLSKPGFGTGNNEVSATGGNTQTNHINQVINMPQNSGMTQQEMDSVLKRNNKQLVTELSNQTLEGKGQFGKSLRTAQGRGNRMT